VILHVDPSSPVPPYEQIRSQIAAMIAVGALSNGHRLPTIRQLAADLDLAGGTVARAYRELEQAGLITSRGRRGTTVAAAQPAPLKDRERVVIEAASAYAVRAVEAGVDPRQALELALKALQSQAQ
jgi:GntR family transcriptional regulator